MSAPAFLAEKAARVNAALESCVATWENVPARLEEAIRHSLFAGGKRLRPALALSTAELVSGDDSPALPAACALEMIHTYSLIHDDLPAMDDDDLRRGKPTCHAVYGEALAILAGDALLTMAFDVLAETSQPEVFREVARAAGAGGMVGGQVLDLQSEGQHINAGELRRIHELKTGALIRASVRVGALLGNADADSLTRLTDYAEHIGLAFQITDDILDVVGQESATGKPVGSDEAKGKATYPSLMGLDDAKSFATKEIDAAVAALELFGAEADPLRELAHFVIERDL